MPSFLSRHIAGPAACWAVLSRIILGGALVTVSGVASAADAQQQHRALVVGIDRYEYPPAIITAWQAVVARQATGAGHTAAVGAGGGAGDVGKRRSVVTDLDGAVNDARAVAEVLRARFQFAAPRLLLDSQATRAGILTALRELSAQSRPGDVVAFCYAGHGSQRVNSRSPRKANHLDQTIVPADANAGQFDVRDVELAAAFDAVLRAIGPDGRLTLIFDSCHSGALSRGVSAQGKARWAAVDPRDAADPTEVRPVEDRGALFLAAAQDFEAAQEATGTTVDGRPHGAFTDALLRVLASVPPNEPAGQLFARVRALVQQGGREQNPAIRGARVDPRRALFGGMRGALAGRTVAPVVGVRGATIVLQGGLAVGIARGAELRLVDSSQGSLVGTAPAAAEPVRLRVSAVPDPGVSEAVVIAGDARRVRPGQLFAVERWMLADAPAIRVWIPPGRDAAALARDAAALRALRVPDGAAELVDDPTAIPADGRPLYVVRYEPDGWRLVTPAGAVVSLPGADAAAVRRAIATAERNAERDRSAQALAIRAAGGDPLGIVPPPAGRPRVAVFLPPFSALRDALGVGPGTAHEAVGLVRDPRAADYVLAGRADAAGIQYAWLRADALGAARPVPMPARTSWLDAGAVAPAADSLTELAARLARVRGWLTLTPPPDTGAASFPYRLALRNRATGALLDSGRTRAGESYDLVLRRDPSISPDRVPSRWVYVLVVDSDGRVQPLFPTDGLGGNRLPLDSAGARVAPAELTLPRDALITIGAPYGIDTFVLLATATPIDPDVLSVDPARGQQRGAAPAVGDPLSRLLARVGRRRGAGTDELPAAWSVQRVMLLSEPEIP